MTKWCGVPAAIIALFTAFDNLLKCVLAPITMFIRPIYQQHLASSFQSHAGSFQSLSEHEPPAPVGSCTALGFRLAFDFAGSSHPDCVCLPSQLGFYLYLVYFLHGELFSPLLRFPHLHVCRSGIACVWTGGDVLRVVCRLASRMPSSSHSFVHRCQCGRICRLVIDWAQLSRDCWGPMHTLVGRA